MKLLTKEIINKLPALGSQDGKNPEDVNIIVKFFSPYSNWTWYCVEGSKIDDGDWEFFGLVRGFENELGYFRLSELEAAVNGKLSLVERDMHFDNHTLAEAQKERI